MSSHSSTGAVEQGPGVWPLYVGLFLVLLVFFIMLVGQSRPDFASAQVETSPDRFTEQPTARDGGGGLAPDAAALAELGGELAGWARFERVEDPSRSEELRMTLYASQLFAPDSAELCGAAAGLIDRAVAALSAPPTGARLEMSLSLGLSPGEGSFSETSERGLAIRRAASFARALIARGAPPHAIAVGLAPGQPERAQLAFRAVAPMP
jgi:hypothetical protein